MRGAQFTPADEKRVTPAVPAPAPAPAAPKQRARGKKGLFQADDPATPDVNEAWVDGAKE